MASDKLNELRELFTNYLEETITGTNPINKDDYSRKEIVDGFQELKLKKGIYSKLESFFQELKLKKGIDTKVRRVTEAPDYEDNSVILTEYDISFKGKPTKTIILLDYKDEFYLTRMHVHNHPDNKGYGLEQADRTIKLGDYSLNRKGVFKNLKIALVA